MLFELQKNQFRVSVDFPHSLQDPIRIPSTYKNRPEQILVNTYNYTYFSAHSMQFRVHINKSGQEARKG